MLKATARITELDEDVRLSRRRHMNEEELAWCGPKTRAEWVDGKVIIMSPDNFEHSDLADWLLGKIGPGVIRGFWLKTKWPWQRPLPSEWIVLKELGVE